MTIETLGMSSSSCREHFRAYTKNYCSANFWHYDNALSEEESKMRDWSKVTPALWRSKKFQNLPTDRDRLLYLYLLAGPHQTLAGCYELSEKYACADLNWEITDYINSVRALTSVNLIRFDHATSELFIMKWFKHNPPMNPKHRDGILNEIGKINSIDIRQASLDELDLIWNEYLGRQQAKIQGRSEYDLRRATTMKSHRRT